MLISAALAMDGPVFPCDYASQPAVMEYLANRLAVTDPMSPEFQAPTN